LRILVTGGAGYVGGFTARHLLAQGHEVVVLDNLSEGHRQAIDDEVLVVGDIADREVVAGLLRARSIEAVLHFAASAYVGVSMSDPLPYWKNNVANSLALLESMLECGVERIVFSSTCSLYGESAEIPLSEEAPVQPGNTYAFTKHAIEQMIRDFCRHYGLSYALLRYFNASGADPEGRHGEDHDPETHLIPLVIQTVLGQRERLEVFGDDYPTPDGTCVRDYVHVEDLARAHELALGYLPGSGEAAGGLVCNLGTGDGNSVLEVIQSVERVTGRRVPFEVTARRPGDAPRLIAGADRARQELGWEARYGDIDGIVETAWAWHRQHPEGYE
jgi:UDP-glucose 4-epimerase